MISWNIHIGGILIRKLLVVLILVSILVGASFVVINYYSYIFSREVSGVVERVERVSVPLSIVGTGSPVGNREMFSYAIAIRDSHNEIVTASSEDRQWAVVSAGQCAVARFYPYPPWELDKSGTFYGARLIKLSDCLAKNTSESIQKIEKPSITPSAP
jgi:hypothetical protein